MRGIFSQIPGKRLMSPKSMMILPEMIDHTDCGILMNAVLAFKRSVKIIIETPRETAMMSAFFKLGFSPVVPLTELPMMTGRSGSVQGASTVNTPATKETMRSIIKLYMRNT
jgi:hypothetical protein